ncbi:PepSY-associated TM helix domain-containing protein [Algoriphagus resistens]|uniref:PepSY-associated TM helix domain-containing protein n=1 Tax=Algoriphagus resistens TaxID=1750590 RepID=UPI000716AFF2|nr:PepSY-associated TM helix domain-containing protein [Algoriphagus resistens]
MSKRNYNVFFNTHTVSGIVISIGLYVIFFAGAFSLFMESIDRWESNGKAEGVSVMDYDQAIVQATAAGFDMHGRSLSMYYHDNQVNIYSAALTDTTLKKSGLDLLQDSEASGVLYLQLDEATYLNTGTTRSEASHHTLGNFLYELHFFDQIPTVGIYLAGIVSVFFLFATITGVIVHWRKIGSNFFTFRIKGSLKNLWTDAHAALGVIGLPFQIMYAITGAIFCLLILFAGPFSEIVYQGDEAALSNDIYPAFMDGNIPIEGYMAEEVSINDLMRKSLEEFEEGEVKDVYAEVHNYHDRNAHVEISIGTHRKDGFFNYAKFIYRLADGELVEYKPTDTSPPYATASWDFIHIIHFGNFGGVLVKILYFLLALLTCFVIVSGVMVWITARSSKAYAHRARFTQNVGAIYLGSCLGLYPAVALMFLLTKTFPAEMEHRFEWISWLFLVFWVAYTVYSFLIKDKFKINRDSLLIAGSFGILIPVFNGFHSGLWLWKSLSLGYSDSFFVDVTWLLCGGLTMLIGLRGRKKGDIKGVCTSQVVKPAKLAAKVEAGS